jgi:sugar phosphate isomerase/epimerase
MVALAAFADEIAEDVDDQAAVLAAQAITFVDVRGVGGRNVVHLTTREVRALRDNLDRHRLEVASLASPVGKSPADIPLPALRVQVEHAAVLAHILGTPLVRIFSFYPPGLAGPPEEGEAPIDLPGWRDAVLARLEAMSSWAREAGVALLVENDRGTYAQTVTGAVDVLGALGSEHLGMVLDPANFVQCGQTAFPDGYRSLAAWVRHVHVKDIAAEGTMTVAGEGTTGWPGLLRALRDDGYAGLLSLEPHLARGGQFGGFTGPDLFPRAVTALRDLLSGLGWAEHVPALDAQEA